jgi:hypothetical protein
MVQLIIPAVLHFALIVQFFILQLYNQKPSQIMKRVVTIALAFIPLTIFGQVQLERSVIGAAGTDAQSGNLQLSYTVGEPVVSTETGGTLILTQGFHQPTDVIIGIDEPDYGISIQAYPNPTEGTVILDLKTEQPHDFHVEVFDATGKRVLIEDDFSTTSKQKHTVNMSSFASGNYYIRLSTENSDFQKSLKVQKIK